MVLGSSLRQAKSIEHVPPHDLCDEAVTSPRHNTDTRELELPILAGARALGSSPRQAKSSSSSLTLPSTTLALLRAGDLCYAPHGTLQTMIAARRITSLEPDLLSVGNPPRSHPSSHVERQRQLNPKQPQLETCGIRVIGGTARGVEPTVSALFAHTPSDLVIKGLASIDGKVPVMFTIDALDECPAEEARILFRILRELLSSTELPVYAVAQVDCKCYLGWDEDMGRVGSRLVEEFDWVRVVHRELFAIASSLVDETNIVDKDDNLTAPWLEYDKLRIGTVVLMRISLRTYSIPQSYTQKKIYQIYVDRVKVIMHGEEPINHRSIRVSIDDYTSNEESNSDTDCLRAFATVMPVADVQNNAASSMSSASSSTAPASPVKQAKTSAKKAGKKGDTDNMNLV
ncbi:hypothetical protein F5887DRAFT_1159030 [Amanita rubescens]|nr:hypothetical protein F5887DRAFT_1159030 [Amanita rubescens]